MTREDELRHLDEGSARSEMPGGIGLVDFLCTCRGNASVVLTRTKEVLRIVFSQFPDSWPSDEEWPGLLPGWFVEACQPELTPEEHALWIAQWDSLTYEEKLKTEDRWSLLDWVYWFQPEERSWWWWDSQVESVDLLRIKVEVDEWPFPSGSLEWVLKVAGSIDVTVEPEKEPTTQ